MKISLLDFKETSDYPSGSGIEFYDGQVYLAGDDAADILIMDKKWREIERVKIFDTTETRIPKSIKSDLEATTIVLQNDVPFLLVLGSGSRAQRNKAILLNLQSNQFTEHDISSFYQRLVDMGLKDLNIESAAVVEDLLILGNRGSKKKEGNYIIITEPTFWEHPADADIRIIPIELENEVAELSGLTYSERNDVLLFTASTEDRDNAYDDGRIGESYFGLIENAYRKLYRKKVKINEIVTLSEIDEVFRGHKIESVCIQSEKTGRLKLHLVADNDSGGTFFFKILARF